MPKDMGFPAFVVTSALDMELAKIVFLFASLPFLLFNKTKALVVKRISRQASLLAGRQGCPPKELTYPL